MHELRLYKDDLVGGGRVDYPPALRVLYAVSGTVTPGSESGDWPGVLRPNEAALGNTTVSLAAKGDATILRWELAPAGADGHGEPVLAAPLALPDADGYLIRCDRVDFPPGGVALLHTHQGPGIRCLLQGRLRVEVEGDAKSIEPLEAWFERGPDPVFAVAAEDQDTSFARVMVLPRRLLSRPSIMYVRAEDHEKPKSQRYTVFIDQPVALP